MEINVGLIDRILRTVLGAALLYLAVLSGLPAFESSLLKYGAIVIGIVMLTVAQLRICPIYTVLGIKTCKT